MEELKSQHFELDLNSFSSLSKEHDIYNSFSSENKVWLSRDRTGIKRPVSYSDAGLYLWLSRKFAV